MVRYRLREDTDMLDKDEESWYLAVLLEREVQIDFIINVHGALFNESRRQEKILAYSSSTLS
jgi:hypothetical protein